MNTDTAKKTQPQPLPRFVVMDASACMPGSVRAPYRRVAIVELEPGTTELPKMISDRARGVRSIVATWERCHSGKTRSRVRRSTRRTAYERAMAEAEEWCEDLNGRWGPEAQAKTARDLRVTL
jgi:hypothetical protein